MSGHSHRRRHSTSIPFSGVEYIVPPSPYRNAARYTTNDARYDSRYDNNHEYSSDASSRGAGSRSHSKSHRRHEPADRTEPRDTTPPPVPSEPDIIDAVHPDDIRRPSTSRRRRTDSQREEEPKRSSDKDPRTKERASTWPKTSKKPAREEPAFTEPKLEKTASNADELKYRATPPPPRGECCTWVRDHGDTTAKENTYGPGVKGYFSRCKRDYNTDTTYWRHNKWYYLEIRTGGTVKYTEPVEAERADEDEPDGYYDYLNW